MSGTSISPTSIWLNRPTRATAKGKFAVIGGAVPWLLLSKADMPHIGTIDVDLSLDAEALGEGEYAQLVESLLKQGCSQRQT